MLYVGCVEWGTFALFIAFLVQRLPQEWVVHRESRHERNHVGQAATLMTEHQPVTRPNEARAINNWRRGKATGRGRGTYILA